MAPSATYETHATRRVHNSPPTPPTEEELEPEPIPFSPIPHLEHCTHSPMLKTASFTSYRIPSHTTPFKRANWVNISKTVNIHHSSNLHAARSHRSHEREEEYKMAGNRENDVKALKHDMVYFKGLMSSVRRFGEFRTVLHTGLYSQVVAMEVPVGGEIGDEVHTVDQILLFTSGKGLATIAGKNQEVSAGDVVVVPAGTQHQFVTRGDEPLELVTIYSPAEHAPSTVHKDKEQADKEEGEGIDEAPEWSQRSKKENEDQGLVKLSGKYDE